MPTPQEVTDNLAVKIGRTIREYWNDHQDLTGGKDLVLLSETINALSVVLTMYYSSLPSEEKATYLVKLSRAFARWTPAETLDDLDESTGSKAP